MTTEHTLYLVRGTTSTGWHKGKEIRLPSYDVYLDGTKIGRVYRAMVTHERRTKGNRYVNARWSSPGWRRSIAGGHSFGLETRSRTDGIEDLIRYADKSVPWTEAEALARTVRNVR